jgi:preprotein translocase subunit YajC
LLALILLQADSGSSTILSLLPLIAIFVVFYLLLFLPNQRRQKKQQDMVANLKNGDRVVTSSGIHGTIVGIRDEYVILRIPPEQVKLEMLKSAVAALEQQPAE